MNVCLILHGLLIWQIDVFVAPFLCRGRVCGPTETQRGYTHGCLHNFTPWVESHPRGQKGSWVCTHSAIPLVTPLPLSLLLHLSFCLMQPLLCASYIVRKCPEGEREGGRGHRRRWQFSFGAHGQDGSLWEMNGGNKEPLCMSVFICLCLFTHVRYKYVWITVYIFIH